MSFKLASVEINPDSNANVKCISILANYTKEAGEDNRFSEICRRIKNAETLCCKFCSANIADLKDVTKVDALPQVDNLSDSEPSTLFCHTNTANPVVCVTPLSRLVADISPSTVLCNGTEMVLHSGAWKPNVIEKISRVEGVFCSRCRTMLGHLGRRFTLLI